MSTQLLNKWWLYTGPHVFLEKLNSIHNRRRLPTSCRRPNDTWGPWNCEKREEFRWQRFKKKISNYFFLFYTLFRLLLKTLPVLYFLFCSILRFIGCFQIIIIFKNYPFLIYFIEFIKFHRKNFFKNLENGQSSPKTLRLKELKKYFILCQTKKLVII